MLSGFGEFISIYIQSSKSSGELDVKSETAPSPQQALPWPLGIHRQTLRGSLREGAVGLKGRGEGDCGARCADLPYSSQAAQQAPLWLWVSGVIERRRAL